MIKRNALLFILPSFLFLASCAKDVSITLIAPPSFAGTDILVDDRPVAQFDAYGASNVSQLASLEERGAIARFTMDVGTHTVRLADVGQRTITFRIHYDKPSEDHVSLNSATVLKLQAMSGKQQPPFLDQIE